MPFLLGACVYGAMPALCRAAAPAPVTATIALHGQDALELNYRIPPFCKALGFDDPGMSAQAAALVRADWRAADDCTEVDFQGIRPRHAACTTLRVRVPLTMRARERRVYDGVHPWAQPLGAGVLAHTAAYAVKPTCGPVAWRVEAPGGTVMLDGAVSAGAAARGAADVPAGGVATLLLSTSFHPDAAPFQAEAAIAPGTRQLLAATLARSLEALRALLPGLPLRPGYALATASPGPALGVEAPSANVMRLLVPARAMPELEDRARALIAHESAHLAQPLSAHDAWPADLPAIREGGAEFLRLAVSVRQGWLTGAALKDQFEAAVNACVLAADGKAWRAFAGRNQGDNALHCGLALHLLGLAPSPARAAGLHRLRDYYRQGGSGAPTDFARGLECGADAACRPRVLPLLQGATPLAAILRAQAALPGSVLHAAPAWGPALVEVMAFGHLDALMRADCHGGASIARDKAAPRIGPGLRCGALRAGMVVVKAEGLPLFAGAAAVEASALACRRGGATVLGLQDGSSVRVSCGAAAGVPRTVFGVDGAAALALMRPAS